MKEIFLLKLGEIVLKGQNRRAFEACLKGNIRKLLCYFSVTHYFCKVTYSF